MPKAIPTKLTVPEVNIPSGRLTLKVPEAAALLGVNPQTVRRLIERGLIKAIRATRHPLIPVSEIQRFASI